MANESKEHQRLVIKGLNILQNIECEDIKKEQVIFLNNNRSVRPDIIGYKNDKLYVVECGNNIGHKYHRLSKIKNLHELIILKYDDSIVRINKKELEKTCDVTKPKGILVDVDDDIYDDVKKLIKKDKVEYPNIKNFIDKSIIKQIKFLKKLENEQ